LHIILTIDQPPKSTLEIVLNALGGVLAKVIPF